MLWTSIKQEKTEYGEEETGVFGKYTIVKGNSKGRQKEMQIASLGISLSRQDVN